MIAWAQELYILPCVLLHILYNANIQLKRIMYFFESVCWENSMKPKLIIILSKINQYTYNRQVKNYYHSNIIMNGSVIG